MAEDNPNEIKLYIRATSEEVELPGDRLNQQMLDEWITSTTSSFVDIGTSKVQRFIGQTREYGQVRQILALFKVGSHMCVIEYNNVYNQQLPGQRRYKYYTQDDYYISMAMVVATSQLNRINFSNVSVTRTADDIEEKYKDLEKVAVETGRGTRDAAGKLVWVNVDIIADDSVILLDDNFRHRNKYINEEMAWVSNVPLVPKMDTNDDKRIFFHLQFKQTMTNLNYLMRFSGKTYAAIVELIIGEMTSGAAFQLRDGLEALQFLNYILYLGANDVTGKDACWKGYKFYKAEAGWVLASGKFDLSAPPNPSLIYPGHILQRRRQVMIGNALRPFNLKGFWMRESELKSTWHAYLCFNGGMALAMTERIERYGKYGHIIHPSSSKHPEEDLDHIEPEN